MRLVIYGNSHQERHLTNISRLFKSLEQHNAWIEVEKSFYEYLCQSLPHPPRVDDVIDGDDFSAAMALSIGGDGTFLRTAQQVAHKDIPILGINTGHLGYLADAKIDSIDEVICDLFDNKYKIEERTMLEVISDSEEFQHPFALNEVAITRQDSSAMISVHTEVNGLFLTTYLGDGIIVSTPTGSTAYNLSVGGPILDPISRNLVISPISPHSLTMRPLVLRDDCSISLTTDSRAPQYQVSLDGRSHVCSAGTTITIRKAPFTVKVIQSLRHNFAETLRTKLMWGTDTREA